ncbi:MAG: ATP synthase F1 subunit gamma [Bacteroidota bacterium]|jgi:F-type H+-transporting ATPase subunit gamma|nr:ATP synthase F1 subunit gamma [Bacteroidota bacterium]HHU95905.1 ATP synthase F1 subunit gamma [Petrimonas sp.]
MARLKEIKSRLQSVQSTRKITSAMMMVSSAKQKRAERVIVNLRPYTQALQRILQPLLIKEEGQQAVSSPYMVERPVKRVAILAFSSNSGLVGRFNENVTEKALETITQYQSLGNENILFYAIGEKVAKGVQKKGIVVRNDFLEHAEKPTYDNAYDIAQPLMNLFTRGEIDQVELIYHHYLSTRSQLLRRETLLPIDFSELEQTATEKGIHNLDYILEPDKIGLLEQLVPKILQLKLYTAHVDSVTSEHAARVIAMQIATDNADELIEELRLEYNKMRQQAITNELLDIMGGTIGQR